MSLGPIDQNASKDVVAAVNELTERDLNIHVNISWYDAATYGTQVPMKIQANEKQDIIMFTPVPTASYTSYRAANQLMDISELLEEYGQNIIARDGDLLKGTSYGVPNYYNLAGYECLIVRKDIADGAGVTEALQNAKTWSEIHDLLMAMSEYSGMPALVNTNDQGGVMMCRPYMNGSENLDGSYWYDVLGDGYSMILTDPDTNTVYSYFDTEGFYDMCRRAAEWYKDGLIYKDAATAQSYSYTLIKSDVGFGLLTAADLSSNVTFMSSTGYEPLMIPLAQTQLSTNLCTKFGYAIPVTSTEPEAAVRYLNYVFGSEELLNLLTWGIEGRDWVRTEDGLADYPEGVTADSCAYHTADFLYGDQMKILPWAGSDPDLRSIQQEAMNNARVSKYMGFAMNTEGYENIITACKTASDRYIASLASGSALDWEDSVKKIREDMASAGMNELVAGYQEQLNAWLADNG
ncbi:MAG: ABC transporter substrate-binding protein [Oscillospiraceae bacterium]|nr:ABC transporter substrate-binding protein [Oscillospiraceae bacterium]